MKGKVWSIERMVDGEPVSLEMQVYSRDPKFANIDEAKQELSYWKQQAIELFPGSEIVIFAAEYDANDEGFPDCALDVLEWRECWN